jgi:aspartyl-tRNA(Asn)/glutamyl-tRNA(Gln) amidotransferase subunit A
MQLEYLGISELRKLLDDKEISSVEMTKYFLARIQKLDGELNSFITVCENEALEEARQADEFMKLSGENPLLCGIPYAAKDLFVTRGVKTTAASKILENYTPPFDATVIAKIKEQKGVLLGKTNLDQFAHGSSTATSAFGPSKNPWDKSRIPGGSSGGSAASLAAGLAPWTLGTETGGSIRQPSSLCGVSGWKPTYGRVSRYGVIAMGSSLDSPGAHAYSVKDLIVLANVMSGRDPKDSTTGDKATSYKLQATSLQGLKVGVPKQYFVDGMEGDVRERVMDGIRELEKLGAELVEVDLPNTKYGSLVYAIVAPAEIASNLSRFDGIRYGHVSSEANSLLDVYEKTRDEGFGDEAKRRILTGTYVLSSGYYDAYYKRAQKVRRLIIDEFAEVFKKVDVLAAPSSPNVAVKIEGAADDPLFGYIADQLNIPSSLAGLPALSLPCGFGRPVDGGDVDLPVGLQLIGPQWGEQVLFDVGMAFQEATDWHKNFPKLS